MLPSSLLGFCSIGLHVLRNGTGGDVFLSTALLELFLVVLLYDAFHVCGAILLAGVGRFIDVHDEILEFFRDIAGGMRTSTLRLRGFPSSLSDLLPDPSELALIDLEHSSDLCEVKHPRGLDFITHKGNPLLGLGAVAGVLLCRKTFLEEPGAEFLKPPDRLFPLLIRSGLFLRARSRLAAGPEPGEDPQEPIGSSPEGGGGNSHLPGVLTQGWNFSRKKFLAYCQDRTSEHKLKIDNSVAQFFSSLPFPS